jgi:hypothetical protein
LAARVASEVSRDTNSTAGLTPTVVKIRRVAELKKVSASSKLRSSAIRLA